jgi:hypothetical protein
MKRECDYDIKVLMPVSLPKRAYRYCVLLQLRFKRLYGSSEHFKTIAIFCAGFLTGMLAMWIAVHVYKK